MSWRNRVVNMNSKSFLSERFIFFNITLDKNYSSFHKKNKKLKKDKNKNLEKNKIKLHLWKGSLILFKNRENSVKINKLEEKNTLQNNKKLSFFDNNFLFRSVIFTQLYFLTTNPLGIFSSAIR